MSDKKTTKQILEDAMQDAPKIPLYNSMAIKVLEDKEREWKATLLNKTERVQWLKTPRTILGSGIPRKLIYTPLSDPDLDYQKSLGYSGEPPFTRGIHGNMYRGKKFTMRQLTGFGSPEQTNERIKFMLSHGATGLNILFDIPTIQMYDSDDPLAEGQVGVSGVCVDSVEDMAIIFKDIPLDQISVSIVTHYPSNTAILFSMFLVVAEERGIPWKTLRGSVQNDITMEELVRSGSEYIPPRDCFRLQCDNIEFIRENVPHWNFITLNGYNLREFGTSAVTASAVAIANAIETLSEMSRRGHDIDIIAPKLAFFWSVGNDFFEEIARLRAVRRLWYKIMKYRFGAKNQRSMWMRCHAQTSGVSLFQQEPLNNIIRSSFHALAAVLGGVQSLHVDSYDEAYSVPTEQAALLSLRTQQIIQEETAITDVVDPLGGSFYVEALTNEIENRILEELDEIELNGGYIKALEEGVLYKKITEYFIEQQRGIENGEIPVVGVNVYPSTIKLPPIDVFNYEPEVERRQKAKVQKLRLTRDNSKVEAALRELKEACKKNKNVLPFTVQCARVRCTEGEMFKVFKEAFGLWKPPSIG